MTSAWRPRLQVGIDPLLQARQPELLEPGGLTPNECLVGQVLERRSVPERQRLLERLRRSIGLARLSQPPTLNDEILEAACVDTTRLDPKPVAAASVAIVTSAPPSARAFRSSETRFRTIFAAVGGAPEGQSSSTIRSVETLASRWMRRRARSARCLPAGMAIGTLAVSTSTGPRTRNSISLD